MIAAALEEQRRRLYPILAWATLGVLGGFWFFDWLSGMPAEGLWLSAEVRLVFCAALGLGLALHAAGRLSSQGLSHLTVGLYVLFFAGLLATNAPPSLIHRHLFATLSLIIYSFFVLWTWQETLWMSLWAAVTYLGAELLFGRFDPLLLLREGGGYYVMAWVFFPFTNAYRYNTFVKQLRLREELARTSAEKDRFLSVVAHDLRNPLVGLDQFLDLLDRDWDSFPDFQRHSYVSKLRRTSAQTLELLESLLLWAKNQSGRLDFAPQPVDLAGVVANAFELVAPLAQKRGVRLRAPLAPSGCIVIADPRMLAFVVRNFLDNAVRFSPQAGEVAVDWDEGIENWVLTVHDQGPGLDAPARARLLAAQPAAAPRSGLDLSHGLGLDLCREFAWRHHGRVASSPVGPPGGHWVRFEWPKQL